MFDGHFLRVNNIADVRRETSEKTHPPDGRMSELEEIFKKTPAIYLLKCCSKKKKKEKTLQAPSAKIYF